ncbi:hypothetical protein BDR26DRAFT_866903 [Obelidium mucronatum]|nr:hypothetical protein BDR26DRAFT_866903 [Obelidium mucronatum]
MILTTAPFIALFLAPLSARGEQVTIKSGGASFPAPAYLAAVAEFNTLYNADIGSFSYAVSDTTTGQKNTYSGDYNFGGSDVAINIAQPNGTRLIALPAIAGGIGISYNLPGVSQNVKFSRTVLPRIFDGTITKWNDPALVKDNPFLANISQTLMVVTRSASSGTSQNMFRGLALMDASTGYANSPFLAKGFKLTMKNSFTAATTASAAIIVGSVAYTMTYLNQLEARDLELQSPTLTTTGLIQHINGEFVGWSASTGKLAVSSIDQSVVQNMDEATQALNLIDTPVAGSYPWTIVSNFVLNPTNISSDYMTTIWTLRFLWFLITHEKFSANAGFIPIAGTNIEDEILAHLYNITFQGQQIYGLSVCDPLPDGTYKNPCVHGACDNPYPFQDASIQCVCEFGYQNVNEDNCSEPAPFFIPGTLTTIQWALFGTGAGLVVTLIGLVYKNRNQPSVKAMSPLCSINILGGCFLGVFAIIYQAATQNHSVCYGKAVIPAVAFGIVFSMIFLKALRIFLIFEYPRIARSRFLRDDVLIATSILISVFDGILAFIYVKAGNIEPGIKEFTDVATHVWSCQPRIGSENTATALMAVLFAFNGLIMVLCVLIGQVTRQAAAKFSESKAVSAMVYVSCAAVMLGLGICFGLEPKTINIYNLHRITVSIATWIVAVISPIMLMAPALHNATAGENSRISTSQRSESSMIDSVDTELNGEVKAFMFQIGLRPNRATALWKAASMLAIPEIDMLILLGGQYSGTFTFSECSIRVLEKTTVAAKKSNEECIELTVGANKTVYLVEFPRKDLMEEFRSLRSRSAMVKKRDSDSNHASSQGVGIRASVASNNTQQPLMGKLGRKTSQTSNI